MTRVRTVALTISGLTIAILVAGSIAAASLSAGAATTSASGTRVTISGIVPVGARDHVTVAAVPRSNSKEFGKPGMAHPVNSTTGAFSFSVTKSSRTYTLVFDEADTAPWFDTYLGGVKAENGQQSDGITSFTASKNRSLGSVDVLEAGVIEGTLSGPDGEALYPAQVFAQPTTHDNDWELIGFARKSGSYTVKVERHAEYRLLAQARNYQSTYFPSAETKSDATVVTADADNGFTVKHADIGAQLARASVIGSFSKANRAKTYESYLYALDADGHPISSIPTQTTDGGQNAFYFWQLDAASYGIAFRDVATGRWLPWKSHAGSAKGTTVKSTTANRCLLPYTAVRGPASKISSIRFSEGTCAEPFVGSAAFSGTVSNRGLDATSTIVASLYYVVPGSDTAPGDDFDSRELVLVNHTDVSGDGDYSLDGISTAGHYVAKFSTSRTSPFFDTWQGGFLLNADDAQTKAIDAAPAITANTASPGNDVSLYEASYVRGVVQLGGAPVSGATVLGHISPPGIDDGGVFYDGQGYSRYAFATTNSSGAYALKIPQDFDYTLSASQGRYFGVYGSEPAGTVVRATTPGDVPGTFPITLTKH